MHPDWDHLDLRDPVDRTLFPITSPWWDACDSGAQLAGLIRLEALWRWGGIYLDSDVEVWRDLSPLLGAGCFAGYEDPGVAPDAILGAKAEHPAIGECLDLAVKRVRGRSGDWRTSGAWGSGPGVTTTVLTCRSDVLVFPPGTFYPYHYTEKDGVDLAAVRSANPWAYCVHHWRHSWG